MEIANCVICASNIKQEKLRVLYCGHGFHEGCITKWFSTNLCYGMRCPTCRAHDRGHRLGPLNFMSPAISELRKPAIKECDTKIKQLLLEIEQVEKEMKEYEQKTAKWNEKRENIGKIVLDGKKSAKAIALCPCPSEVCVNCQSSHQCHCRWE